MGHNGLDPILVNENPLERITWKFRNLRTSTLSVDFGKISSIMSIFSLLRCAPQIEQLHIEVDLKETQGDDEIHEGTLEAYMSDDLVKTLKCVTLAFIKCFPGEMSFIKLLLSKAASLESLKVMMFWHHIMPISDACLLFAAYKKASSTQVKFIVEHGMDTFNIVS
uniref:FBD domain-containing protein n=1 Tax=Oryza punctata TaxID=4537 RepID=A0A0E0LT24_ORYPU